MEIVRHTLYPFQQNNHPDPNYQEEVDQLLQGMGRRNYNLVCIDPVRVAGDGGFREARMFFFQQKDSNPQ